MKTFPINHALRLWCPLPLKGDHLLFKTTLKRWCFSKVLFMCCLQALVPITKEVIVPLDLHRFIIGQRGREVRQMMDDHDVNISVPSPDQGSDVILVKGSPANVARAEQALMDRVKDLEAEKEDRVGQGSRSSG